MPATAALGLFSGQRLIDSLSSSCDILHVTSVNEGYAIHQSFSVQVSTTSRTSGHALLLLHEPEYDYQPPVNAMNNLPLLFIIELLVFIGIVEDFALALFQMLVAGCIMSLEL
jgi:hypothetical protein